MTTVDGKLRKRWTHLSLPAARSPFDQEQNSQKERLAWAMADMVEEDLRQGKPFVLEREAELSLALDYYRRFCGMAEQEWAKRLIVDAYRHIVKIEYRWRPDGTGRVTLCYDKNYADKNYADKDYADKNYAEKHRQTLNLKLVPETDGEAIRANEKVKSLVEDIQLSEVKRLLDIRFSFYSEVKVEKPSDAQPTMSREEYIDKRVWQKKIHVTPREKRISHGYATMFLDINSAGRRKREYLNLQVRPEKTAEDGQFNARVRRITEEIARRVTLQIANGTFVYGAEGKEPLVLSYYREICGRHDSKELRQTIAAAYDDHSKIRFKPLAKGGKSIVMDVFVRGERTKKALDLYCEPGDSKDILHANEHAMEKAEKIRLRFNELYLDHLAGFLKLDGADKASLGALTSKLLQLIKEEEESREAAMTDEPMLSKSLPTDSEASGKSHDASTSLTEVDYSKGVDWDQRMRDAVNMLSEKLREVFGPQQ